MGNGFLILVEITDGSGVAWAYHFAADEEAKSKKAFAKLIADELHEPIAETIKRFQNGEFSIVGLENTFITEIGPLKMSFRPTVSMGAGNEAKPALGKAKLETERGPEKTEQEPAKADSKMATGEKRDGS